MKETYLAPTAELVLVTSEKVICLSGNGENLSIQSVNWDSWDESDM